MSKADYERGFADGLAGNPPDFDSLALGANSLNDYERGYVDDTDWRVAAVHQFHGTRCLCGFDSHGRSRSMTEHILAAARIARDGGRDE